MEKLEKIFSMLLCVSKLTSDFIESLLSLLKINILQFLEHVNFAQFVKSLLNEWMVQVVLYHFVSGLSLLHHVRNIFEVKVLNVEVRKGWWLEHLCVFICHFLYFSGCLPNIKILNFFVLIGHPQLLLGKVVLDVEYAALPGGFHIVIKGHNGESVLDLHGAVLGIKTKASLDVWEGHHWEPLAENLLGDQRQVWVCPHHLLQVHDLVIQLISLVQSGFASLVEHLKLLDFWAEILKDTENHWHSFRNVNVLLHWVG